MLLIADSGSTKCDWVLFKNSDKEPFRIRTKGLNPSILAKRSLKKIITNNLELSRYKEQVTLIYFFGAGCNTKKNKRAIYNILTSFFEQAVLIVEEDLMAAVWATTNEPAVVCIIGTGSNCCYYDGNAIHKKVPSLGHLVMDEGSGNYFGKELLKSYYYNQLPVDLRFSFEKRFDLKGERVIKKLYQSATPNKYLAEFTRFLFENKEHPFISKMIFKGMNKFIENHLLQYTDELKLVPIHFVGSVAYFGQDFIISALKKRNLEPTSFVRRPIHNLINNIKEKNISNLNKD